MNIGKQIKKFREQEGVNTGDLKRMVVPQWLVE